MGKTKKTDSETPQEKPATDEPSKDEGQTSETEVNPEDVELAAAKAELAEEEEAKAKEEEGKAEPEGDKPEGKDKPAEPKPEPEPDKSAAATPAKEAAKQDDDGATPDPDPDPDPEPDKGDGKGGPMIPKGRFDEALIKERAKTDEAAQAAATAKEEAAYWKGRAEGAGVSPDGDAAQAKPGEATQTPDEIIAGARQTKRDLAKKYDDGEITAVEFEEQKDHLEDTIAEARQQKAAPQEKPGQKLEPEDDLYLDQVTATLEKDHPWTLEIKEEWMWDNLRNQAVHQLHAEGVKVTDDNRGRYVIRERMATLTDTYGPLWYGKSPAKKEEGQGDQAGDKDPSKTGSDQAEGKGLSPEAKARKEKLELADKHPPDTSSLGAAADKTEPSEADITAMSDEEIAALPPATRRKILPE